MVMTFIIFLSKAIASSEISEVNKDANLRINFLNPYQSQ